MPERDDYTVLIVYKFNALTGRILNQDTGGYNNLDTIIGFGALNKYPTGWNVSNSIYDGKFVFETHGPADGDVDGIYSEDTHNDGELKLAIINSNGNNLSLGINGEFKETSKENTGMFGSNGTTKLTISYPYTANEPYLTRNSFVGDIAELLLLKQAYQMIKLLKLNITSQRNGD